MSENAGTLSLRFIQISHLNVESVTTNPESRGGVGSVLPPTEKTTAGVTLVTATDTSFAETRVVMQ